MTGMTGKRHSEETKQKIAKALRGRSRNNPGRRQTDETKRKLSKLNKGKKLSDETKRRISESKKRREHNEVKSFFLSLPLNFSTKEKRLKLFEKYPNTPRSAIYVWVRKWLSN